MQFYFIGTQIWRIRRIFADFFILFKINKICFISPIRVPLMFLKNEKMKKLILFLTLAGPLSISAQKAPVAVEKAFANRFPNVKEVKYDKEGNGEFEASFKVNGLKMSANFKATGDWVETESEIPAASLPSPVTAAIKKAHPKSKIVGAAKIETAANGTRYEAYLKRGLLKAEVLYDENGNFIKWRKAHGENRENTELDTNV